MTAPDAQLDIALRDRVVQAMTTVLKRLVEREEPITEDMHMADELGVSSSLGLELLLEVEEQLGIQRENQAREIAVAEKNKERVIAIETERIEKDRMLEVVTRQREVELSTIAKEMALETEKRAMAEVTRERIAVDKTVAEQEENIKRLRVVEEAEREQPPTGEQSTGSTGGADVLCR